MNQSVLRYFTRSPTVEGATPRHTFVKSIHVEAPSIITGVYIIAMCVHGDMFKENKRK